MITHFAAHITKAIRANDYASMKDDAITYRYAVFQEDVWVNHTIAADLDVIADFRSGANLRPVTHVRILTDANKRANKNVVANLCRRRNDRRGMYFRLALFLRVQDFSHQSEG